MRWIWVMAACLAVPAMVGAQTPSERLDHLSTASGQVTHSARAGALSAPDGSTTLLWGFERERLTVATPEALATWTLHLYWMDGSTLRGTLALRTGLSTQDMEAEWLAGQAGKAVILRSKPSVSNAASAAAGASPQDAFIVALAVSESAPQYSLKRLWSGDARTLKDQTVSLGKGAQCGASASSSGCLVMDRRASTAQGRTTHRSILPLDWPKTGPKKTDEKTAVETLRPLSADELAAVAALTPEPKDEEPAEYIKDHAALALATPGQFALLRHYDTTGPEGQAPKGRVELSLVSGGVVQHTAAFRQYADAQENGGGMDEVSAALAWVPGSKGRVLQATLRLASSEFGGSTDEVYTEFFGIHCTGASSTDCTLKSILPLAHKRWNSEGCMHRTDGGCMFEMGTCARGYDVRARVLESAQCSAHTKAAHAVSCLDVQETIDAHFTPSSLSYEETVQVVKDGETTEDFVERRAPDMDDYFGQCEAQLGAGACHAHWHEYQSDCRQDTTTTVVPLSAP